MKFTYATLLLLSLFLLSSCSNHTFLSFYKQEKEHADIAVAFPKYMAMIAVPGDSKEEVKYFTKGMKKIRVLFSERPGKMNPNRLKEFLDEHHYEPYIVVKDDGTKFNLYTQEDDQYIREIVMDMQSKDEAVVVALLGKMDKSTFKSALAEAQKGM